MGKAFFKLFLLGLAAISFCTGSCFAKEKPQVIIASRALNGVIGQDSLLDAALGEKIAAVVERRLLALEQQGALPFTIARDFNNFTNGYYEGSLVLQPLILNDRIYREEFFMGGTVFAKARLMTQLNLLLCYYPGQGEGVRILYNWPLAGYSVLGGHGEYENIIPKRELQKYFLTNIEELVGSANFSSKGLARNLEERKQTCSTYQVGQVFFSSAAAQQAFPKIYGEDYEQELGSLIAGMYSAQLAQKHLELVVLPNKYSGNWEQQVAEAAQSTNIYNTAYRAQEGEKQIALDVKKISSFPVPNKDKGSIYGFKGYGAALGDGQQVADNFITVEYLLSDAQVSHSRYYDGIFAEVLCKVAKELAEKYKED